MKKLVYTDPDGKEVEFKTGSCKIGESYGVTPSKKLTTAELSDKAWEKYHWTYRNNRGCAKTVKGFIRFGIPEPQGKKEPDFAKKGGDRIGFEDVLITQDMVGETLPVFTSIEVKGPGDKLKPGQIDWHNFILEHNGISEVWSNEQIIVDKIELKD